MALLTAEDFAAFSLDSSKLSVYLSDALAELRRVTPALADLAKGSDLYESARAIVRGAVLRRLGAGLVAWEQRTLTKGSFSETVRTGSRSDVTAILTRSERASLLELLGIKPDSSTGLLPRGCFPASVKTGSW